MLWIRIGLALVLPASGITWAVTTTDTVTGQIALAAFSASCFMLVTLTIKDILHAVWLTHRPPGED